MAITVKGQNVATVTGRGESSQLEKGASSTITWSGSKEAIEAQYSALLLEQVGFGNIDNITKNTAGVPCTCTATYGASQDPTQPTVTVTWELSCEQTTRPIEVHPRFKNILSPNYIEKIKKAVADGTASLTDWSAINGDAPEYNIYRDLLIEGTTTYLLWQFNLRKMNTAARLSDITVASSGIGLLITQTAIGFPSDIGRAIPNAYEFLKGPITIGKAGRKVQITEEFLGSDDWDDFLYTTDGGLPT